MTIGFNQNCFCGAELMWAHSHGGLHAEVFYCGNTKCKVHEVVILW